MLEAGLQRRTDCNLVARIPEKIAEHADTASSLQGNHQDDVGDRTCEVAMRGVPRAPRVEDTCIPSLDLWYLLPAEVPSVALVTDPLGTPLPATSATTLHEQLFPT